MSRMCPAVTHRGRKTDPMKELVEIRNRLPMHWEFPRNLSLSSLISPSIPSSPPEASLLLTRYLAITTRQLIMLAITLAAALSSVAAVQAETVLGAVSKPREYPRMSELICFVSICSTDTVTVQTSRILQPNLPTSATTKFTTLASTIARVTWRPELQARSQV